MSIFMDITALAKATERLLDASLHFGKKRQESALEFRKEQLVLLQDLTKSGIDPNLFDLMLTTELDRKLKVRFGIAFFVATAFFTLLSFAVIVFNSIDKWGINDVAITGLIIETPLQFIGLLYIIARNLFPQPRSSRAHSDRESTTRRSKAKPASRAPSA